jgi:hypothetical protein
MKIVVIGASHFLKPTRTPTYQAIIDYLEKTLPKDRAMTSRALAGALNRDLHALHQQSVYLQQDGYALKTPGGVVFARRSTIKEIQREYERLRKHQSEGCSKTT